MLLSLLKRKLSRTTLIWLIGLAFVNLLLLAFHFFRKKSNGRIMHNLYFYVQFLERSITIDWPWLHGSMAALVFVAIAFLCVRNCVGLMLSGLLVFGGFIVWAFWVFSERQMLESPWIVKGTLPMAGPNWLTYSFAVVLGLLLLSHIVVLVRLIRGRIRP
jgi:hypothetical protein